MKNSSILEHNDTIPSVDWTDSSLCEGYLHYIARAIQAPSLEIAASQFSKKYARVVVVPALSAMSLDDKTLDVSINNCLLDMGKDEGKWSPSLQLVNAKEIYRTDDLREKWREQTIETLFAEHVSKMWDTLSDVTKISKSILWENTAVRIFSLYEKKLMKNAASDVETRIMEDFEYLIHGAKGNVFGTKTNPLKQFYTSKQTENSVRVRQTCCYYYQTGAGKYCGACPKKE